jgi:ActR/RegA family two-component response regulator
MQNKSSFAILGSVVLLVVPKIRKFSSFIKFIEDRGAQVIAVATKADALNQINLCQPDVLVVNCSIEDELDGEALLNDLLFIKQEKASGILLVDKLPEDSYLKSKNYRFLEKPASIEDIFNTMSELVQKKLLESALNFKAFEVHPMEIKCRVVNIDLETDMIEADQSFITLSFEQQTNQNDVCELEIINFLNEKGPSYKLSGVISRVEKYDDRLYLAELKIDESCLIVWKKLYASLVRRQNESVDFINSVQG